RLLVIVNDVDSQPGLLTQWMISENVEFDLRIGGVSPLPAPSALESYDGLITLGGGYMPDETDRAPWLAEEAELVRHSLDGDLPLRVAPRPGRRWRCAGPAGSRGGGIRRYPRQRRGGRRPGVRRDPGAAGVPAAPRRSDRRAAGRGDAAGLERRLRIPGLPD